MVDHTTVLLALRTQALTLSVCTTGSTTLAATAAGYTRAAGSFVTDGFAVGMEVTPTGFTTTTPSLVTAVTANTLTVNGSRTVDTAAAGRTVAVGLPALRAWENTAFTPVADRWFLEEDYLPGPVQQITLGAYGQVETLPMYVLRIYGAANTGVTALYKMGDALLALFAPRTALVLSTGDVVRVRTSPAPYRGQVIPTGTGWSVLTVTVPLLVRSANTL